MPAKASTQVPTRLCVLAIREFAAGESITLISISNNPYARECATSDGHSCIARDHHGQWSILELAKTWRVVTTLCTPRDEQVLRIFARGCRILTVVVDQFPYLTPIYS